MHMSNILLKITGLVEREMSLTFDDLSGVDAEQQIADMSEIDPKRKGGAVRLAGLLALAGLKAEAAYLGLHASKDDFHASVPLEAVRERGLVIYRLDAGPSGDCVSGHRPLDEAAGGPVRFYIPDFAACHTAEVDECANVKFVDWIELTAEKGFDNRPHDGEEHEALHEGEG